MDGAGLDLTLFLVIGLRLYGRLDATRFCQLVLMLLLASGVSLVLRERSMLPRTLRFALSVAAAAGALLHASAGLAQDDAKGRAGLETWRSSGCVDCHGPFADGNRDDDDYPVGANLRTTRLDAAGIKLTIRCGRPGTGMPSFDGGAYTVRACYGRPLGAAPDNLQPTPRTLSLDEIDALVAYLQARIVGHGKVTREECLFYYEDKADCDDFK
jgi:mono/diheme cytochrome c family protein